MSRPAQERYTIISADTHAGGSHEHYREYLDAAYVPEFDAWRARYQNPYKDLKETDLKVRNWDSARRWTDQEADGVVAEVLFPNTVPPFFPAFALCPAQPTEAEYPYRLAGIRAHNRWLADFVAEHPDRRAGIGQIFLNDIEDAIADVRWIAAHGLRGGVLLPNVPPDVKWIEPLHHPHWDPLWAVCEELRVPLNIHAGTGVPEYAETPSSALVMLAETHFYSERPLQQLILGGVFERFRDLRLVVTEAGCAWVPGMLRRLDDLLARLRSRGTVGEMLPVAAEVVLPRSATEYFRHNVSVGVSFPSPEDVDVMVELGNENFMWGSDYPHVEGTQPYTREHLRQLFHATPERVLREILAGNAAAVYDFDLDALAPFAERWGPRVDEVATPLDRLPDNPNQALARAAGRSS